MANRDPTSTGAAAPSKPRLQRLAIGVEVDARYRLEEIAGTGGMSTVWRAHDERLDRTVAIKVMSDSLAADAGSVTRFAREIRVHSNINHRNLVRVFDYSVSAPRPYLVMEYIPGASLSQRLESGELSGTGLTALACDLLSAIGCVHDHGVLHRDIKPANVLIDAAGRARLTDFGIAHLHDSTRLTHPGNVVGTLRFLAPELLAGMAPTRQSDLFALGVTLSTAGEGRMIEPALRELIDWLTQPKPRDRPLNAQTALTRLTAPPIPPGAATIQGPTLQYTAATVQDPTLQTRTPRRLTDRWRRRVAATAALGAVVLTIAVLVGESVGSGGSTVPRFAAGTQGAKPAKPVAAAGGKPTRPTKPVKPANPIKPAEAPTGKAGSRGPTIDSDLNALADAVKRAAD
jgi:eukaryotic-like serine/threonine-protein kinase